MKKTLLAVVILAVAIQLVPYGRNHTNPPVVKEPEWNSPETRALAVRACFDCHSNEDRKSTRLNSSHSQQSRMPSSA